MSRIGKEPIKIPAGVNVDVTAQTVAVKGSRGELSYELPGGISASLKEGELQVGRADDSRQLRAMHGLARTLCANMVVGVTTGYKRNLVIDGTGFRAQINGSQLLLSLGFASPKEYKIPEGVKVTEEQGIRVTVEGNDKQQVGEVAAAIRSYFPAEPYKGKGIRYADETIRRKQGKKLA